MQTWGQKYQEILKNIIGNQMGRGFADGGTGNIADGQSTHGRAISSETTLGAPPKKSSSRGSVGYLNSVK